jgi:hypothetical protein
MKKVYEVEFRGQKQKYTFDTKQQAEDFATIQAVFGGKQYRIKEIIVGETQVLTVEGVKILESTKIDISEEVTK